MALALAGCQVQATGLHECQGDEVALILDCGHHGASEYDAEGRELVTCRNGATAGDECLLEGKGFSMHCMPAAYCEAICGNGSFVCE